MSREKVECSEEGHNCKKRKKVFLCGFCAVFGAVMSPVAVGARSNQEATPRLGCDAVEPRRSRATIARATRREERTNS